MKRTLKRVAVGIGAVVGLLLVGGGGFAYSQASAFDASLAKVYDLPLPAVEKVTDPERLARGKHLVEGPLACASRDCHGGDLAGGRSLVMGPVMTATGSNVTPGGVLAAYSDAELARLVRHGVKRDGRSLVFMPVDEINWVSDADLAAAIGYLRTVPAVERPNGPVTVGLLGKILDRRGKIPLDVARRVDHGAPDLAPPPSPTAAYGAYLARSCRGCHGQGFRGGPIPGAPKETPVPSNLTIDPTGLAGWTFEDFDRAVGKGLKKSGEPINPFMPLDALAHTDETERRALWAYFQSVPPGPFGAR